MFSFSASHCTDVYGFSKKPCIIFIIVSFRKVRFLKLRFKWLKEMVAFDRESTRERKIERDLERRRRHFAKELWNAAKAREDIGKAEEAWADALKLFPLCVQEAWKDKGMHAKSLGDWEIFKAAAAVQRDRGNPFPYGNAIGTVGIFMPEKREICYYAKTAPGILDYPYSWKAPIDVCGHEISHFIDWVSLFPSKRKSFEKLFEEEGILMEEYSRSDVAEFFADACWLYMRFPEITVKWLPKTMEWFECFFNALRETEVQSD